MKPKFKREYLKEKTEGKTLDKVLIKRLLRYLYPFRWLVILAIVLLVLSKAIEAAVPFFLGEVSQRILNGINLNIDQKTILFSSVFKSCLMLMGLLFLSYTFDSINVIVRSWVGQKAIFSLRSQVYHQMIHMPLSYYDHHTVGRLMTRTIHDVDQINQLFAESVVPILGNILLFASIFVSIVIMDWQIAILVIILLPFVWILTNRFRHYQRVCYERVRTVVSAMNTFVQENLMGASTIRSFGLQNQSKEHFEEINEDHCNAYLESIHHFATFIAGIDFLQNLSLILVFMLLVYFAPSNTGFNAGMYFTFSLYALMFFRPLADLAERYNVLQSAMAASERVFAVLDHKAENIHSGDALREIRTIEFDQVWFAYEKDNWVLRGLSFQVKEGESLAFVGVTGEGKTTIMSLLLRFYEYQEGTIRINGRDIREYSIESIRKQFSVVLQDPVIFSGTISENISLYDPEITTEQMQSVIKDLGMDSLVNHFSDGLQHALEERGKTLSVGETQLISLARAAAHKRSVLILDEATANIDAVTERIIQDALKKILKKQTALVIAHRLSTIKDVTRILVLHHGVVAESGTHHELLAAKGIYEKLYRLQFT